MFATPAPATNEGPSAIECGFCDYCIGGVTTSTCGACHNDKKMIPGCVHGDCGDLADCSPGLTGDADDFADVEELAAALQHGDEDQIRSVVVRHADHLLVDSDRHAVALLGGCTSKALVAHIPVSPDVEALLIAQYTLASVDILDARGLLEVREAPAAAVEASLNK